MANPSQSRVALLLPAAALLAAALLLPLARSDADAGSTPTTAYDELRLRGFPRGLLPANVRGYTLDADSGDFAVDLVSSCRIVLPAGSYLANFNDRLTGHLDDGRISGLSGISVKAFFRWWSITGIRVQLLPKALPFPPEGSRARDREGEVPTSSKLSAYLPVVRVDSFYQAYEVCNLCIAMAGLSLQHPWAFAFGLLGNVISFASYLAPIPTFYRIYKSKSTEGFQSVPYVVALFSAMLWIYYALVKSNESLLITINAAGCVIETIYIVMYLAYAPRKAKLFTVKILLLLNVGVFGLILLLTLLLAEGEKRVVSLGWVCVAFSVSVFIAPLSIIGRVIKTRSVEYMPFSLSLSLTLSAVVWFLYGLLIKDKYVALPNILGFSFGLVQMGLYMFYMNATPVVVDGKEGKQEGKLPAEEHVVVNIAKLTATPEKNYGNNEVHPVMEMAARAAPRSCVAEAVAAPEKEAALTVDVARPVQVVV